MFGIVYGAEGADFPDVEETGPYTTLEEARAAIDLETAGRLGGWFILSSWEPSDGESIMTGAGDVVETNNP